MSKKGSIISLISGPFAVILLVTIMVIFGVAFIILSTQIEDKLEKNTILPQEDTRLLNYINTPIEYKGQKTTLGDFIISSKTDKEKRRYLRSKVKHVISPCNLSFPTDRMKISMGEETFNIGLINTGEKEKNPKIISSIYLPPDINITLYESINGSPHFPKEIFQIKNIDEENNKASLTYLVLTAFEGEIIEDCNGRKWVYWGERNGIGEWNDVEEGYWSEEGILCETEIINGKLQCKDFPIEDPFKTSFLGIREKKLNELVKNCFMFVRNKDSAYSKKITFNIDPNLKIITGIRDSEKVPIKKPDKEMCVKAKEEFLKNE